MWKIAIAFAVFAVLSLFVIMQGGDTLDMGGEQHGTEQTTGTANGAATKD